MENTRKVNEHVWPLKKLRRGHEVNQPGNVTESPEASAEDSFISPQQPMVSYDNGSAEDSFISPQQPMVSDGELHSPLIEAKDDPYTDDMFGWDLPQDEPTPIATIHPDYGSDGEIGKKSSSEDVNAKGTTDGVESSPGIINTSAPFRVFQFNKKRKHVSSKGTGKSYFVRVRPQVQTILLPPPHAPAISVQNNNNGGGEINKKSSCEDHNAQGKIDGVASSPELQDNESVGEIGEKSSSEDVNAKGTTDGVESSPEILNLKQPASKGPCEGTLSGCSSVRVDTQTIIPPPPPAPTVTVATTSANKPSLPVRVQSVLPHVEEILHSDKLRETWSFAGADIPSEIIHQNIENIVQVMVTLVNLSEACEQLKKDKDVECSKLMTEIKALRDERNNIMVELDQLKKSSSIEIDQLKKARKVVVDHLDHLKAEMEQVKAAHLQAIEETKDKEGENMNNMFFQLWKHNRNVDLSFLNGGETSLIEACERRLVEEKQLQLALRRTFPRSRKEVQGDSKFT